ncbi:unnamed protein product [Tilletia controversa]|nr:hypothetical protein CF335_g3646 [Tilletia laevis]CAD6962349.1 unnamed protein product [Tilletia controversa]CAD7060842.1 unnamed protein product [Tilletia caries]
MDIKASSASTRTRIKASIIRFQTVGGELQYEETSRQEASVMSDLEGKDLLVYTHIRDSDNEGIWTKTINFAPISTRQ